MVPSKDGEFVIVLPPYLAEEEVAEDDTSMNSEGYTSRIFQCCQ